MMWYRTMLLVPLVLLAQATNAQDSEPSVEDDAAEEEQITVTGVDTYTRALNIVRYGDAGLDGDAGYEGIEIATSSGLVVKYLIQPPEQDDIEVDGENVSLTNMTTGESRTVVPQGSGLLIFNWMELRAPKRAANADEENYPVAYAALVGTRQDYLDGVLDLVIGRFSDLEQVTLVRRLDFVDAANAVDPGTVTLIAWDGPDSAEFLKIRLADFAIVDRKPVALPQPETVTAIPCGD